MRINQDYAGKCLIIDEELNTDAIMFFFNFWNIPTNHYGMGAQIRVNYRLLYRCSPSSQIMGCVRSIMIELSNEWQEFYLKRIG
jgi:hypothetical protein